MASADGGDRTVRAMQVITPPRPRPHAGSLVVGTLLGGCLVAAGLGLAFLTLEHAVVVAASSRAPAAEHHPGRCSSGRSRSLAGGVAPGGRDQPARRSSSRPSAPRPRRRSPVVAASVSLPPDVVVATDVVPDDGPADPGARRRTVRGGRHPRTRPARPPSARSGRRGSADAGGLGPDRASARRAPSATPNASATGSTNGDLDFVVRVHAALITADAVDAALAAVRGHHRGPDPRLDRGPAAPAVADRRPTSAGRGAGPGCGPERRPDAPRLVVWAAMGE